MVTWDDKAPVKFLEEEWANHSTQHESNAIQASSRLQFIGVAIRDIVTKNYKLWHNRIAMYGLRYRSGKPIGTLFCRKLEGNKWFLKDGNHRFIALVANGETTVRIAYDPEGKI